MQGTHVLGEALSNANIVAISNEEADGSSILVSIARGEALVGAVHEDGVALGLAKGGDLLPLLDGGVHTGGVVGAGVEHEDGAILGSLSTCQKKN